MKTSILSLLPIPGAARELGRRGASLALLALLALTGPAVTTSRGASASPPDTMTYQGFLVDANGNALAPSTPQNYPVVFRIYAVASGVGSSLWSEQQIVTVDKGNFSVLLGEGTPVGGEPRPALSSVFSGATASDRYIGISVTIGGATTEILPRLRLVPSPYAFLATSANSLVQPNGSPFLSYDGGQVNISGNLGLGTVAAGRRLQVGDANTANSEGMIRLASRSGTGGASRVWDFGVPETDQDTTGIGYSFVIDDVLRPGPEFMVQFGTGNVGIGTATPNAPLSFGNSLANTKLALWDGGPGAMYGFGVQPGQFRMHINNASDRFSFLNGPAGSEVMRIQGNGNVGIGTGAATPGSLLQLGSVGLTGDAFLRMESIGGNQYANGIKLRNFSDEHGFDLINQERAGTGLQANGFHIVRHFFNSVGETAVFVAKGSGHLGVGTTAPTSRLHVSSPEYVATRIDSSSVIGTWLALGNSSVGGRFWQLISSGSGNGEGAGKLLIGSGTTDGGTAVRMTVQENGNVGLGTSSPADQLHMRGGIFRIDDGGAEYIRMYRSANGLIITGNGMGNPGQAGGFGTIQWDGDGNWDSLSDRRLKRDIVDAEPVMDRLMQLPVRRYRWKGDDGDTSPKFGVIAQEVKPLFPESVGSMTPPGETNEMFTVKYASFGLLAVKALQELKAEKDMERAALMNEISSLKKEVEELKGKVAKTARVEALEEQLQDVKQIMQSLLEVRKNVRTVSLDTEPAGSPVTSAAQRAALTAETPAR